MHYLRGHIHYKSNGLTMLELLQFIPDFQLVRNPDGKAYWPYVWVPFIGDVQLTFYEQSISRATFIGEVDDEEYIFKLDCHDRQSTAEIKFYKTLPNHHLQYFVPLVAGTEQTDTSDWPGVVVQRFEEFDEWRSNMEMLEAWQTIHPVLAHYGLDSDIGFRGDNWACLNGEPVVYDWGWNKFSYR